MSGVAGGDDRPSPTAGADPRRLRELPAVVEVVGETRLLRNHQVRVAVAVEVAKYGIDDGVREVRRWETSANP